MKNPKTIRVTCTGAATLPLEQLKPLQGDLKSLSEENHARLRTSILKHGITFPFFVWRKSGKKNATEHFIVDAHQRDKVLQRNAADGYAIPEVPVVWIDALDEAEAKEKILLCNSSYGHISEDSLNAFIAGSLLDVNMLKTETALNYDLAPLLSIPETNQELDEAAMAQTENECPKCHFKW